MERGGGRGEREGEEGRRRRGGKGEMRRDKGRKSGRKKRNKGGEV